MPPIPAHSAVPALTREQCRAVDRYAIDVLGIPGVVLMENAGRNAADLIEDWVAARCVPAGGGATAAVCIVCGKGNNGGDGFVIARHLFNRGYPVSIDLAADPAELTGDAAVNCRIVEAMGLKIGLLDGPEALARAACRWARAGVLVDALLGTGFTGRVREPLAGIIEAVNAVAAPLPVSSRPLVVAVDVPSGLDAGTGRAGGPAVRADETITFLAEKVGYQNETARAYLGRLTVVDIGAPTGLILARM